MTGVSAGGDPSHSLLLGTDAVAFPLDGGAGMAATAGAGSDTAGALGAFGSCINSGFFCERCAFVGMVKGGGCGRVRIDVVKEPGFCNTGASWDVGAGAVWVSVTEITTLVVWLPGLINSKSGILVGGLVVYRVLVLRIGPLRNEAKEPC